MDWVSSTYNKLEGLAVAADRLLGAVVGRYESWLSARRAGLPQVLSPGGNADAASCRGNGGSRQGPPFSA